MAESDAEDQTQHLAPAASLVRGIAERLRGTAWDGVEVRLLEREPQEYQSTSPSEILTLELGGGDPVRFLCKYAAPGFSGNHGHRGGIEYEARVYDQVLRPLDVPAARSYGVHAAPDETPWLLLEYLEGAWRCAEHTEFRRTMAAAAAWAGRFHRLAETTVAGGALPFLNRYGVDYYAGWARRAVSFAGDLHARFPWLDRLARGFEELAAVLVARDTTVIHGEFYPHNILLRDPVVYPIDWETAAVGAGEIDLASLIEQWEEPTIEACRAAYESARWPHGTPADFPRRWGAARMYVLWRWLGDRPDWVGSERSLTRFEQLRAEGERWGLL